MRFLLLFLTLLLQFNVSGYNLNNLLNNCAEKTLTSENQYFNERSNIDFRYQGQYEDVETGLYYNRFRWYSPDEGMYISQDPIGINGGFALYGYVKDVNSWIDSFGLAPIKNKVDGNAREVIARDWLQQRHPNAEILSERYLRDIDGKSVRDIDIAGGSRRRLDFVVIENGKVVGVYEVTSKTARKTAQIEKERIIKGRGGTYIKESGRKGKLYNIFGVETTRLNVDLNTKKVSCN